MDGPGTSTCCAEAKTKAEGPADSADLFANPEIIWRPKSGKILKTTITYRSNVGRVKAHTRPCCDTQATLRGVPSSWGHRTAQGPTSTFPGANLRFTIRPTRVISPGRFTGKKKIRHGADFFNSYISNRYNKWKRSFKASKPGCAQSQRHTFTCEPSTALSHPPPGLNGQSSGWPHGKNASVTAPESSRHSAPYVKESWRRRFQPQKRKHVKRKETSLLVPTQNVSPAVLAFFTPKGSGSSRHLLRFVPTLTWLGNTPGWPPFKVPLL